MIKKLTSKLFDLEVFQPSPGTELFDLSIWDTRTIQDPNKIGSGSLFSMIDNKKKFTDHYINKVYEFWNIRLSL